MPDHPSQFTPEPLGTRLANDLAILFAAGMGSKDSPGPSGPTAGEPPAIASIVSIESVDTAPLQPGDTAAPWADPAQALLARLTASRGAGPDA